MGKSVLVFNSSYSFETSPFINILNPLPIAPFLAEKLSRCVIIARKQNSRYYGGI